jgi:hypothetical protein
LKIIEKSKESDKDAEKNRRLFDLLKNINNRASKVPQKGFLLWKNLTKDQNLKDKDKSNKIIKNLDKIFMAQRAKGRMALDNWNGWMKQEKSKE